MMLGKVETFLWRSCRYHCVAATLKELASDFSEGCVVFDDQDCFGTTAQLRASLDISRNVCNGFHSRQVDSKDRALARLAVHPNVAAALLHDAVNGGEAEPCALRLFFGGEERLKNVSLSFFVHSASRVANR